MNYYTAQQENANIKDTFLYLVINVCVRKWGKIKKGSRFSNTVWQYLLNTQTKWPSSLHLREAADRKACFCVPEEMCAETHTEQQASGHPKLETSQMLISKRKAL